MTKFPSYAQQRDQMDGHAATLGDKARVGDVFPTLELTATSGQLVTVPDSAGDVVHLQLRRFAGCPICNLHLRSIVDRHDEIRSRGIREVVVFHSTAAELAAPSEGSTNFSTTPGPRLPHAPTRTGSARLARLGRKG